MALRSGVYFSCSHSRSNFCSYESHQKLQSAVILVASNSHSKTLWRRGAEGHCPLRAL